MSNGAHRLHAVSINSGPTDLQMCLYHVGLSSLCCQPAGLQPAVHQVQVAHVHQLAMAVIRQRQHLNLTTRQQQQGSASEVVCQQQGTEGCGLTRIVAYCYERSSSCLGATLPLLSRLLMGDRIPAAPGKSKKTPEPSQAEYTRLYMYTAFPPSWRAPSPAAGCGLHTPRCRLSLPPSLPASFFHTLLLTCCLVKG